MYIKPKKENNPFIKSGIIKLLKQFSPKEISEFEKFIRSPFFNNHSTLIKLFTELKKYYPAFDDKKLTKNHLYKAVNKGKRYNDTVFRKYISNLMKLAEEYLNILEIRSQEEKSDLNILKQFIKKNLNDLFEKKMKLVEKKYKHNDGIYDEYFFNMHMLQDIKLNYFTMINKTGLSYQSIVSSQSYLINYFLYSSVHDFRRMHVLKDSLKLSNETSSLELFYKCFDFEKFISSLNDITGTSEKEIKLLELYYHVFQLNQNEGDPANYFKLKSKILECEKYLDKNLLYIYMSHLIVYCILETANGREGFERELFENFKSMLENGLYNRNRVDYITNLEYRAILRAALSVNELEWAEYFINHHKNYIEAGSRENIFNFGYALLFFERKDYLKSLSSANKLKFDSYIYSIDVNTLLLQIFYELNYFDSAISLIDNFKHYLRNNKVLSSRIITKHEIFLKYYKKLLKLKKNPNYTNTVNLKDNIDKENFIFKKKWMLEKLYELIPASVRAV